MPMKAILERLTNVSHNVSQRLTLYVSQFARPAGTQQTAGTQHVAGGQQGSGWQGPLQLAKAVTKACVLEQVPTV